MDVEAVNFEDLYATPIFFTILENKEINKQIDDIIDDVDFNTKEGWSPTHYLSTDFKPDSDCNVIEKYNLTALQEQIDKYLIEYLKILSYGPVDDWSLGGENYQLESWFSLFKKGNYAHIHSHGSADLSGVYYYKTNSKDGDIFFEPPFPQMKQSKVFYQHSSSWDHIPDPGKLMLFPGWLPHGVKTNTTDNDRISLSFNIRL
mgnify:FL=1